jgi:hypothetical protein
MSIFLKSTLIKKNLFSEKQNDAAITCKVYANAIDVDATIWNSLLGNSNAMLQLNYLDALEKVLPNGLQALYIIGCKDGKPVFIAYTQLYTFNEAHLGAIYEGTALQSFCNHFKSTVRKHFLSFMNCANIQVLVIGNLLHTSQIGMVCKTEEYTSSFLEACIHSLKEKADFDIVVLKDFSKEETIKPSIKKVLSSPFYTQPNMIMRLPNEWNTFDDYMHALDIKYKKRWKNTIAKNKALTKKVLNIMEVVHYEKEIYALYEQVHNNSTTKINKVQVHYFSTMKKQLLEKYQIIGYFEGEKLVAFSSYFNNLNGVEANYVGFEYLLNKQYKLYQTILYDYIEAAITHKATAINFGRTGLEIKSTVGAIPQNVYCFLHFERKTLKPIIKPFLQNIKEEKLEQRHPFKEKI